MASICDGTKQRGARNCGRLAQWLVRDAQFRGQYHAACDAHLGQVGAWLLGGERGELEVQHIMTREK